ncbi:MAG: hypothetical protein ACTHNP_14315 [Solirubrobacterales bacterium]
MKERAMVPRERPTTYYGRPIVKPPVWKAAGAAAVAMVAGIAAGFLGRRR